MVWKLSSWERKQQTRVTINISLPPFLFFSFFWHHVACRIFIPRPEIAPVPAAVGAWSPNACTALKCQHPFLKAHLNTWSQWMTLTALRGRGSQEGVPLTAELGGDLPGPSRDLFPHRPLPVPAPCPQSQHAPAHETRSSQNRPWHTRPALARSPWLHACCPRRGLLPRFEAVERGRMRMQLFLTILVEIQQGFFFFLIPRWLDRALNSYREKLEN